MEVLLWILDSSRNVLDDFHKDMVQALDGKTDPEPIYWYQDGAGSIKLNAAVSYRRPGFSGSL